MTNKQIPLVSRPAGAAVAENFRLIDPPVPPLADGEVLVQHHYLSLDPYMRGRMSDAKSYAAPQPLHQRGADEPRASADRDPHLPARGGCRAHVRHRPNPPE